MRTSIPHLYILRWESLTYHDPGLQARSSETTPSAFRSAAAWPYSFPNYQPGPCIDCWNLFPLPVPCTRVHWSGIVEVAGIVAEAAAAVVAVDVTDIRTIIGSAEAEPRQNLVFENLGAGHPPKDLKREHRYYHSFHLSKTPQSRRLGEFTRTLATRQGGQVAARWKTLALTLTFLLRFEGLAPLSQKFSTLSSGLLSFTKVPISVEWCMLLFQKSPPSSFLLLHEFFYPLEIALVVSRSSGLLLLGFFQPSGPLRLVAPLSQTILVAKFSGLVQAISLFSNPFILQMSSLSDSIVRVELFVAVPGRSNISASPVLFERFASLSQTILSPLMSRAVVLSSAPVFKRPMPFRRMSLNFSACQNLSNSLFSFERFTSCSQKQKI